MVSILFYKFAQLIMKQILLIFLLYMAHSDILRAQWQADLQLLRGFPSGEPGVEQGVSACFAGCVGNTLVVAGGCNFPEQPAVQGGRKHFYRGVYTAQLDGTDSLHFQLVGQLPVACAYGVSLSVDSALIMVGGTDGNERLRGVWRLRLTDGQALIDSLPSLPEGIDNGAGTVIGSQLYVWGDHRLWSMDLHHLSAGWRCVAQRSERRQQPVAGVHKGQFALWGGFSPRHGEQAATLSYDGFVLSTHGTQPLPPPMVNGRPLFLGGAGATTLSSGTMVVTGGVCDEVFLPALNALPPGYMNHEPAWYRFLPTALVYHEGLWQQVASSPHLARAGASLASHGQTVYVVGGELKPGVRLPSVVRLQLHTALSAAHACQP